MAHEIVVFDNGQASLRDPATGEPMHSRLGPWAEAMRVHVEPSGLAQRILNFSAGPLVVLDLGMGIAANALAALDVAGRSPRPRRKLHLVSVDTQKEGLAQAAGRPDLFPFLTHPGVKAILEGDRWSDPEAGLEWEIRLGDFRALDFFGIRPEIVFFDFYSPRSAPDLWTSGVFEKLHSMGAEILTTYSAATSARSAMMLGGFHVGDGGQAGEKAQTTLAARDRATLSAPLDERWLRKFEISSHPLPAEWTGTRESTARERIRNKIRLFAHYTAVVD